MFPCKGQSVLVIWYESPVTSSAHEGPLSLNGNLDQRFGHLRLPEEVRPHEVDRAPVSRVKLDCSVGRALASYRVSAESPLFRNAFMSFQFIWAIDEDGTIWLAFEELCPDFFKGHVSIPPRPGHPRWKSLMIIEKLGHPTLLNGQEARAAGELALDDLDGGLKWVVNFQSGRYCRVAVPNNQQAAAIHKRFRELIEPSVELDFEE